MRDNALVVASISHRRRQHGESVRTRNSQVNHAGNMAIIQTFIYIISLEFVVVSGSHR